jgi:hypothetical protein
MTTVFFFAKWGRGNDKRQVAIHILHFKLEPPSEVSLAYATYITIVLILPLTEHL